MGGSGQVDVEIRAGDIVTLISSIVETTESGGTQIANGGAGYTDAEPIKFVLVNSDGTVLVDAAAATLADGANASVSYSLDTNDYDGAATALPAGRYTYYWIVDSIGGGTGRRRTEDLTLSVGPAPDTYTGV